MARVAAGPGEVKFRSEKAAIGCLIWPALLMLVFMPVMLVHSLINASAEAIAVALLGTIAGVASTYWCLKTLFSERDWIVFNNRGFLRRENKQEIWQPWSECRDVRIWQQPNGLDWVVVDILKPDGSIEEFMMPGYCGNAKKLKALILEFKAKAPIVPSAQRP